MQTLLKQVRSSCKAWGNSKHHGEKHKATELQKKDTYNSAPKTPFMEVVYGGSKIHIPASFQLSSVKYVK